jgi:hypothetical protein
MCPPLMCPLAFHFMASKERARVTFTIKELKNEREKTKGGLGRDRLPLIRWELFPCSVEMQQVLIFWPPVCWCCMLWPCLVLCASVPLRTGDMGTRICAERRLGGIMISTLVAVEVWMSWWWNDRGHVGSGHGFRAPIDCAWSRPSHRSERVLRLGVPVAHYLA